MHVETRETATDRARSSSWSSLRVARLAVRRGAVYAHRLIRPRVDLLTTKKTLPEAQIGAVLAQALPALECDRAGGLWLG